jgi:hypothetical protein
MKTIKKLFSRMSEVPDWVLYFVAVSLMIVSQLLS